jgi:cellulose synthase/poly-beta-1,6-N-acetylglucosamine synthase-like glycosyltransferase
MSHKSKQKQQDRPIIGLIASLNPVPALELTVRSLFKGGASRVIVVDDGSYKPESLQVFDRIEKHGAEVIHLKKNMGKSKALKAGFLILPKNSIIVQTDDDTLAGDLTGPVRLIRENKADIVDIRVETTHTHSLLGYIQELDYWLINAFVKRIQNFLRARLWMSGASVMYSYEAGKELIQQPAYTMTEDTEGLFRARSKGFRVKFYAGHEAQFATMVPEDWRDLRKQWRRWATGNGQVMRLYGLGGGNPRIAIVNALTWVDLVVVPIPVALHYGIVSTSLWAFSSGILMGLLGAIRLKRARLALIGVFFPIISIFWTLHAIEGLFLAWRQSKSGETVLTWVPPERTALEVGAS